MVTLKGKETLLHFFLFAFINKNLKSVVCIFITIPPTLLPLNKIESRVPVSIAVPLKTLVSKQFYEDQATC